MEQQLKTNSVKEMAPCINYS